MSSPDPKNYPNVLIDLDVAVSLLFEAGFTSEWIHQQVDGFIEAEKAAAAEAPA